MLFICFSFLALSVSAQENATKGCLPGMVHYFGLDETAAGTYTDYVATTPATCSTCPIPAAGLFAGAQQFEGKSKGLMLEDIQHFEWGPNSSFTIELWVKTSASSSQNQVLIGRDGTESPMLWWLGINKNGNPEYVMYDRSNTGFSTVGESVKVNDGKWHHLAVVRDGRLRLNKLYVDGYTVGNYQFDYKESFESTAPVNIGFLNLNNGYGYKGLLDELKVYDRALTESEMRAQYNGGAGNYCGPQLVKPQFMSAPVTHGVAGQQYAYSPKAVGNPKPSFQLVSGPAGMIVNAATGEVTWKPTAEGSYEVTIKVQNSVGEDTQRYTIKVKKDLGEKVGLLHHWMLHEISGTRYRDFYTPYDAVATAETRPKPVSGVVSGAQEFDGVDDGLDVTEGYNFDWKADENFSLELWMRTEASTAGNRVLIGRDAKDSEAHWWVGVDEQGRAGFQLLDLSWQGVYVGQQGPKLNDGQWHQLVAVRNGAGSLTELYVDGAKVAQGTHTYTSGFDSGSPVNIGYLNDGGGYHFEGVLDEIKLFGRALTAAEVQERYSSVFEAITELVRFEGAYANGVVQLTWETAAEAGLLNFEIQRAPDTEAFETIGTVEANGNSNTSQIYSFNDTDPLPDKAYYRLKINNQNGTHTYSNIILIKMGGLTATYFTLYPNPIASGEVYGALTNLPAGETVLYYVTDLAGRKVLEQTAQVDEFGELKLAIPITERFVAGIYNVSVVTSKRIVARKLMVQ
ncbi:LamG domain-containing protein [Pontibacter sp. E15-1]|uniref:LamG-like jellyroll fold domain-containing protein n=1 Tax=Pontibacter sp. E15-1 TaxID=2919918 RepID=UPI001F4F2801|nr:LamG-like jellyroll fold domain-containing protein [Pontibacter sp. E15-1]MCJ8166735.1 LamG domain-containing protein [Pontibacter sp. E15-1]